MISIPPPKKSGLWIGLDAGNTRLKWSASGLPQSDGQTALATEGVCQYDHLYDLLGYFQKLILQYPNGELWISNVNHQKALEPLLTPLANAPISIHFAQVDQQAVWNGRTLLNHYAISQLGIDRWLTILACWSQCQLPHLLIVSLGTATTIDYVQMAPHDPQCFHYQGGVITAGLQLGLDALHQLTAHLPQISAQKSPPFDQNDHASVKWPTNTHDALWYGALQSQVHNIFQYIDQILLSVQPDVTHTSASAIQIPKAPPAAPLSRMPSRIQLSVTGGAHQFVLPLLNRYLQQRVNDRHNSVIELHVVDNAVLRGLELQRQMRVSPTELPNV